jgi:hypothetical protein
MFVDLDNSFPSPDPKKIQAGVKYLMDEIKDRLPTSHYDVVTIVMEWGSPYYSGPALAAINEHISKKGWQLTVLAEDGARTVYKVTPTYEVTQAALLESIQATPLRDTEPVFQEQWGNSV